MPEPSATPPSAQQAEGNARETHALQRKAVYRILLCSGEMRSWRYLGPDAGSQVWWRDMETGLEFNESSLMYAWQIVNPEE